MFESLQGTLKNKEPTRAIVEVGGIGYRLVIPLSTYNKLPGIGTLVFLYLSQVIREDAHTLYAFLEKGERDLFEVLITLTGIGPKTAIGIIGHMDMGALQHAIAASDIRLLSKIPGIGKKTAERLVLEMKDKLVTLQKKEHGTPVVMADSLAADAVNALMNLGYHPTAAQKAVQEVRGKETDLGSLITAALKKI